jgi:RNA polymerase sigma-70 factor (ECF subfamily)
MSGEVKPPFAELMRAVASNRDQQAFTIIFDYYAPRLKSWLMSQRMEGSAAEELVQEVMMTVWQKAALYDADKSSLSTWLYRIARNRKIDNARRQKTRVIDEHEEAFQPAGIAPADQLVEDDNRERLLAQVMSSLPEEQVGILRLAFFQGLTHIEISDKTGLPLGTVKSRLRLAFGKLRRLLEQNGVDAAF